MEHHLNEHLAEKITSLQTNCFGDGRVRFFLERSPPLSGHPISGPKRDKISEGKLLFLFSKVQKNDRPKEMTHSVQGDFVNVGKSGNI